MNEHKDINSEKPIELWSKYIYPSLVFLLTLLGLYVFEALILKTPIAERHLGIITAFAIFASITVFEYNQSTSISIDNKEQSIIYMRIRNNEVIPFSEIHYFEIKEIPTPFFTVYRAQFITRNWKIYTIRKYLSLDKAKVLRAKIRANTDIDIKAPEILYKEKKEEIKQIRFKAFDMYSKKYISAIVLIIMIYSFSFSIIGRFIDLTFMFYIPALALLVILFIPFGIKKITVDFEKRIISIHKLRRSKDIPFSDISSLEVIGKKNLMFITMYHLYINRYNEKIKLCTYSEPVDVILHLSAIRKRTRLKIIEPETEKYKKEEEFVTKIS